MKKDMKCPLRTGSLNRGSSSGNCHVEKLALENLSKKMIRYSLEKPHLLSPFLRQNVRLGALDSKCWDSYNEVTFVKTLGPHNGRIDNRRVNARDFGQNIAKMCPIEIKGIDLGVGIWVCLGNACNCQAINPLGQLVHHFRRSHSCYSNSPKVGL